jgi:AbrB family looped-hinge helix DNA binding protein
VPKAIRDRLGLKPGDDLEFDERGDEIVIVARRRRNVLDFAGALAPAPGVALPVSTDDWKRAIRDSWVDAAAERQDRIQRQGRDKKRA